MSIVGLSFNGTSSIPVYWANADPNTVPTPLKLLTGDFGGIAFGINNLGQIVGTSGNPLYWANADPNTVPTPLKILAGDTEGNALGINNLGQIVGSSANGPGTPVTPLYWANADPNTVPTSLKLLAGDLRGYANGINNLGQIVGGSNNGPGTDLPVYWANADPNTVPTPLKILAGDTEGNALGINNLGQIVGSSFNNGTSNIPVYWANADPNTVPTPLKLLTGYFGGYANGINNLGQIVGSSFNDTSYIPVYWANINAVPTPLNLLTGDIRGDAYGISDPPTPTPPISNICFPAGTPVQTDQGIINIDHIDKNVHTIRQKPILHVTRTTTLDNYLISIEKDSFGKNMPHSKTLMTKDHKIMFEGRLVPAYRFLDYTDTVKKMKYNGETLYNILLADYGTMNVNNLMCETLHPENIIAKLYLKNYTEHERTTLVHQMNMALVKNDVTSYKDVVHRLTSKM